MRLIRTYPNARGGVPESAALPVSTTTRSTGNKRVRRSLREGTHIVYTAMAAGTLKVDRPLPAAREATTIDTHESSGNRCERKDG